MKKRIGWLNNKPIIQGDKNLKNSNELHIDELSSSNSEGDGNIQPKFYKLDKQAIDFNNNTIGIIFMHAHMLGVSDAEDDHGIKNYNVVPAGVLATYNNNSLLANLHTMSFIPMKNRKMDTNQQFGDYTIVNSIYDIGNMLGIPKEDVDNAYIEITEEEFYNFNPNKQ